jgi:FkbM family methyltransferase
MAVKSIKQLVQGSLRQIGYDIGRTRPGLITFLQTRKVDVVFDVGGNEGQFGHWLRQGGYQGRIVSFEPIRSVFDVLKAHAANDKAWEAHHVALGEASGQAVINVAESSVFSSLLPLRSAASVFDTESTQTRAEEITIATLDQFAPSFEGRNCFLKIDTQGFERQVLLGAKKTLPTLKGVQMELPVIHLYAGVWGLADAISFMSEQGFVVAQMNPVNCHHLDPVSWVETDCLFRRVDPRID